MNGMMLFLCIIWGFNFVVMKMGNDVFPPVLFAAYRFLLGAIVLFGLTWFKKIPLPSKRELKWYILCGILQTTYFNIAIQISLHYVNAGLTSVLTYSMPLFLSLLAHYLFLYSFSFEHGESHWSIMAVLYLLYSGILASALAFVIWSNILSKMEASKASISLLIVPVVGTLSGFLFLREDLNAITLIGIILVLSGVWAVNHAGSARFPLQKTSSLNR